MSYLYRHIRIDKNEPFYIGIGSDETYKRAFGLSPRSKFWKSIVAKTEYVVEIMLDGISWDEACKKEQEFIKLYGRRNINSGTLVNLTDGGEGNIGMVVSDETRAKKSEKMRQNYATGKMVITDKRRHDHSLKMKAKYASGEIVAYNKGRAVTEKMKDHLRLLRIGVGHTDDERKMISETLKAKYASGELIAPWKGKKLSQEHKDKIGIKSKGRIDSDEARLNKSMAAKAREAKKKLKINTVLQ